MELWIGLGASVIFGLIGIIYWLGRSRDDRQDEAIAGHVKEDIQAHERLKAVETKVATLENEVANLRERWHDHISEVSKTLSSWYLSIVEMIRKDRE